MIFGGYPDRYHCSNHLAFGGLFGCKWEKSLVQDIERNRVMAVPMSAFFGPWIMNVEKVKSGRKAQLNRFWGYHFYLTQANNKIRNAPIVSTGENIYIFYKPYLNRYLPSHKKKHETKPDQYSTIAKTSPPLRHRVVWFCWGDGKRHQCPNVATIGHRSGRNKNWTQKTTSRGAAPWSGTVGITTSDRGKEIGIVKKRVTERGVTRSGDGHRGQIGHLLRKKKSRTVSQFVSFKNRKKMLRSLINKR